MLTMESIQDQLIKAYRNKNTKHAVELSLNRDHYNNLCAELRIFKCENREAVKLESIPFYQWEKKKWQKKLETSLAILNGEVDPFEEEKTK